MTLSREQLRALADALRYTRDLELTCDEWLAEVPGYLESAPDEQAGEAFRLVREHLQLCPECREVFEFLLTALKRRDATPSSSPE